MYRILTQLFSHFTKLFRVISKQNGLVFTYLIKFYCDTRNIASIW